MLLPRLLASGVGLVFLTARVAVSVDPCPVTGHAGCPAGGAPDRPGRDLSPGQPGVTAGELEKLWCRTFHQLGHSLFTQFQGRHQHPMLLARCRYASVRPWSAARRGPGAVARHVARTSLPARRRQPER